MYTEKNSLQLSEGKEGKIRGKPLLKRQYGCASSLSDQKKSLRCVREIPTKIYYETMHI